MSSIRVRTGLRNSAPFGAPLANLINCPADSVVTGSPKFGNWPMAGSKFFALTAQHLILAFVLCGALVPLRAAEVRGTVSVNYQGLFKVDTSVRSHPVSVALFADDGQTVAPRPARTQHIDIVGNRMHPAFTTVQAGDSVEFINHDGVFHELFSLSPSEPVSIRLGKAYQGVPTKATLAPDQPGTTHVFCRIHNKSYARIDVVETPHIATVQPGEQFQFTGLEAGLWKLRLASPAAETQWVAVTALTGPPAVRFTLVSHGGGTGTARLGTQAGVEDLYR
jgi:plastocyanin